MKHIAAIASCSCCNEVKTSLNFHHVCFTKHIFYARVPLLETPHTPSVQPLCVAQDRTNRTPPLCQDTCVTEATHLSHFPMLGAAARA